MTETRHFQSGDMVEILDIAPSKGQISWVEAEPVIALFQTSSSNEGHVSLLGSPLFPGTLSTMAAFKAFQLTPA